MFSPSRIAAVLAAGAALAAGLAPVVANMDWTSTAGILAAVFAIAGVAMKWLEGRAKYDVVQAQAAAYPPVLAAIEAEPYVPPDGDDGILQRGEGDPFGDDVHDLGDKAEGEL